jgi:hypothetical protein
MYEKMQFFRGYLLVLKDFWEVIVLIYSRTKIEKMFIKKPYCGHIVVEN